MLALKQKVLFHKNCKANYTSQLNLQSVKRNQEILSSSEKKVKNHHQLHEDSAEHLQVASTFVNNASYVARGRRKRTNLPK